MTEYQKGDFLVICLGHSLLQQQLYIPHLEKCAQEKNHKSFILRYYQHVELPFSVVFAVLLGETILKSEITIPKFEALVIGLNRKYRSTA